jgi:hypothetical protein
METVSIEVPDLSVLRDYLLVIIEIATSVGVIYKWIISPLKKIGDLVKSQEEDIADILCDRLQQAHDFYCYEQGWCTAADKERLIEMYKKYRDKGRNH